MLKKYFGGVFLAQPLRATYTIKFKYLENIIQTRNADISKKCEQEIQENKILYFKIIV